MGKRAIRKQTEQARGDTELWVLGPLELRVRGERVALPRSKKARALLGYLATNTRAQRRERLCDLLWDVTDDPRGALRWSLSRLRQVLGNDGERIEADREEVSLRTEGMRIDAHELSQAVREGLARAQTAELEDLASIRRGEFLEGLDLPDFLDFNAWLVAERERFREEHCAVLGELVKRLASEPQRALPFARQRALSDAFSVDTQTELLGLLVELGRVDEARQRFEGVQRLYREVGASGLKELELAWLGLRASRSAPVATRATPSALEARPSEERTPDTWPFVGRQKELTALAGLLEECSASSGACVALVIGEPGSGKSRLSERLQTRASNAGFEVLRARAFEAESTRPYGPWADAVGVEPHELIESLGGASVQGSREALFAAVAERLVNSSGQQRGILLVIDDVQWLDSDSAELLHYVVRIHNAGPLMILLLARAGELADNEVVLRALRSMRRERRVEEIELEALSRGEIGALVAQHGDVDVDSVYEASAGNPLYAIELARAQSAGAKKTSATLLQLVRERVDRLPAHAADVLRWGAVLGHAMDIERLEALSSLELERLVDALERLEHNALLRIDATRTRERYVFSHDVVREAVYSELSYPRRRLMHRKVALMLEPHTQDVAVATEVAHHAGLAGEALLGVRACIVAGNQSLRVFANGDAEALARRGLRLAEELEEPERIGSTLDLLHIQFAAKTPDREQAAAKVRELAERALDLGLTHAARLGFQMLSFLRWESASMADAHANIMQAERVSRAAGPDERTVALAQAAKCLVLLERNLSQAEAFALEANALAERSDRSSSAVSFAIGMIAAHRGELAAAVEAFREARQLARQRGERLAEFCAVEHWVMLEIDGGSREAAAELASTLVDLGGRVRPGAEEPTGRALVAFVQMLGGDSGAEPDLRRAVDDLRAVDAKYELSFLLTRWARHELDRGNLERARDCARDALDVACAIGRPSEKALAHTVLAQCARLRGEETPLAEHVAALRELGKSELSRAARSRLEVALGETHAKRESATS